MGYRWWRGVVWGVEVVEVWDIGGIGVWYGVLGVEVVEVWDIGGGGVWYGVWRWLRCGI